MASLLTWPLLFTFLCSHMKSIHTMMSAVTSVAQLWNKKMKIISNRLIDILHERYLRLDLNWLFWNQSNCNIQSESETIQFTKCWIIKDQTCNQEQFWERLYIKVWPHTCIFQFTSISLAWYMIQYINQSQRN